MEYEKGHPPKERGKVDERLNRIKVIHMVRCHWRKEVIFLLLTLCILEKRQAIASRPFG